MTGWWQNSASIHLPNAAYIGNANAEDTAKDVSHDNAMCASRYCLCIAMVTGTRFVCCVLLPLSNLGVVLSSSLEAYKLSESGRICCCFALSLSHQRPHL